jgi:hypothetical protein
MTQEERFEARFKQEQEARFAQRFADEQRAAVVTPEMAVSQIPMGRPSQQEGMTREQSIAQIPTGGMQAPQEGERVEPRSIVESMMQGAMAVPVISGFARGAQLLSRGSRAAPYAAQFAGSVIPQSGKALLAEGVIGAAAGGAAEIAARQVPADYSALAEMGAGAVAGGVAGGAAGALSRIGGFKGGVEGLLSPTKELMGQVANLSGAGKATAQAATALSANPQLAGTIKRAAEIEKSTGISLPMLAQANGDTTISSYMQSQISKGDNSEFTAQVKQQYLSAEKALAESRKGVAPSITEVDAYVKRKALEVEQTNAKTVAAAKSITERREQGLDNINNRILELSTTLQQAPGRTDIGERLTSLISAKQAAAFKEVSPKYTKLIEDSEAAGIRLPGEVARDLREYATDTTYADSFRTFPVLFRKLKGVFGDASKDSYSLKDLDSLKRETNSALRSTTKGTDQYRIMRELKSQVDTAINNVDPLFSAPYRAIDKEYATRVGLPFSEQGVVNINRAKFVELSVPAMTKNASSLKQTMDIVGDSPEGVQIVKDAFLFDIGNNKSIINTGTGELNPAQLKRYIAANKEKIDLVPGLRDDLNSLGGRVGALRDNRTSILEAEKAAKIEKITNLWSQSYGTTGGITGVVKQALDNPQQLDALLAVAGNDRVAREGIKSAVLDDLLSAPGDRLALLETNKEALSKVFGKEGTQQLTDIVEASQRLKDNPFKMNININTITKSKFEKDFGTRPDTSLGEWRNQILTAPRVLINHVTRYFSNQANKNEAAEVQKFLLDSKALETTASLVSELNVRGFTERASNLVLELSKNSASSWLLGATAGGAIGAQDRERQQYTPSDPTLLQGYGQ